MLEREKDLSFLLYQYKSDSGFDEICKERYMSFILWKKRHEPLVHILLIEAEWRIYTSVN